MLSEQRDTSMSRDSLVALVRMNTRPSYPSTSPYHPSERYPEAPFDDVSDEPNSVYSMIRRLWLQLGYDADNFGRPSWNPLGAIIRPGSTVILKPNLVSHINFAFKVGVRDTDCLVTHGSIIRAVADYVAIAQRGRGRIILGDCPIQATDWSSALAVAGIDGIAKYLSSKGVQFLTRDFRLVVANMDGAYIDGRFEQNCIEDYVEIDLASESLLMPIIHHAERFAVSDYDVVRMRRVHNATTNRYLIPREILDADCVINLPKMKSHVKAGVTLSLKNLVGIIGHKDYLPHFRFGSPRIGSDEYPHTSAVEPVYWGLQHRLWKMDRGFSKRLLYQCSRAFHLVMPWEKRWEGSGGWHGNDTLWRTILDINRAFFYGSSTTGLPDRASRRTYLSVVDGVIGGDHEGPLAPRPVPSGLILGGVNPAAVDWVSAIAMGYDPVLIPSVAHAFDPMKYRISDIPHHAIKIADHAGVRGIAQFTESYSGVPFRAPSGWAGHIEDERGSDPIDRKITFKKG